MESQVCFLVLFSSVSVLICVGTEFPLQPPDPLLWRSMVPGTALLSKQMLPLSQAHYAY